MTFKFCFENEIRRCSEPPKDFSSLASFLSNMFTTRLPSEYTLSYTSPEGQTIYLDSEEKYQKMLNSKSSQALKIFINRKEPTVMKQEVQRQAVPEKSLSETNIVTHFQQEQKEDPLRQSEKVEPVREEVKSDQAEDVKRIVREAIKEDMPYIISQVKEALMKEGLLQDILAGKENSQKQSYQASQDPWPVHPNPYYQRPYDVVETTQSNKPAESKSFIGKMMETVADLPNKATEMIGNFVDKFDKEVYLECPEGRYAKSVVETANQLQEVFPDEIRKELLDFVKGLPKDMPLDQVADMFAHRQIVRSQ